MKNIFLTLVFILASVAGFAQQSKTPIIEVTGSAELEIVPDEIVVSVTLREFMLERQKQQIADIEREFRSVVEKLKIENSAIALESVYGSYDYDYKTNKRGEFLNSKTYTIKLVDLEKYNKLVMMLDKKGIENVYLARTSHSKIEQFRTQVKVAAVQAAKAKADLMLAAVNKKAGQVMLIRERDNNMGYPMPYLKAYSNTAMMESDAGTSAPQPIDVQKIKLRYEVEIHFVIE